MEQFKRHPKDWGRVGLICLILLSSCHSNKRNIVLPTLDEIVADTACIELPINYRDSLQAVYTSFLGVRESTGRNDGYPVSAFLASTGLPEGPPWCVAFVYYCFLEVGMHPDIARPAYSPDWFVDSTKVVYRKSWMKSDLVVKPAMVGGYYYPSKGRIAHGFFIDYEDKNNYYTVQGNTNIAGSNEGDGVYAKIIPKSKVYVISDFIQSN